MQKTITIGKVEIVVRTAVTVRDDLNAMLISQRVQALEPDSASGFYDQFGELCAHVVSAKGLPFDPISLADKTPQDAYDAYCLFMNMHKTLRRKWAEACTEVDSIEVDPATGLDTPADADPNS